MFENTSIFITGAGGGIGRATALAFARTGGRVTATDVQQEGLDETARLIGEVGGECLCILLDVTDADACQSAVDAHVAHWGSLDFAFNNAGVTLEGIGAEWGNVAAYQRTMDINAGGVLHCMRAELGHMVAQGRGAIVNTASIAGESGAGGAGYCASKHAIIGLTRSAALHFATKGVRVNAVCPGTISTPMTAAMEAEPRAAALLAQMQPIGRMGRADEIAAAVLFLCSDAASFITGHPLAVDGGFLAR